MGSVKSSRNSARSRKIVTRRSVTGLGVAEPSLGRPGEWRRRRRHSGSSCSPTTPRPCRSASVAGQSQVHVDVSLEHPAAPQTLTYKMGGRSEGNWLTRGAVDGEGRLSIDGFPPPNRSGPQLRVDFRHSHMRGNATVRVRQPHGGRWDVAAEIRARAPAFCVRSPQSVHRGLRPCCGGGFGPLWRRCLIVSKGSTTTGAFRSPRSVPAASHSIGSTSS